MRPEKKSAYLAAINDVLRRRLTITTAAESRGVDADCLRSELRKLREKEQKGMHPALKLWRTVV